MRKYISLDLEKCTGCRCCELVCSLNNEKIINPEKARIRLIRSEDKGKVVTLPVICQQCEDAPCKKFCPTRAISRNQETGALIVDENICIGCKRCVFVCPFGMPFIDEERGTSIKCNLCDGEPKCVEVCPKSAVTFVSFEKQSIKKKRDKIEAYIDYQKTIIPLT